MALLMRGAGAKFFQPGPHGGLALGRFSDKRGGAAAEGRGPIRLLFLHVRMRVGRLAEGVPVGRRRANLWMINTLGVLAVLNNPLPAARQLSRPARHAKADTLLVNARSLGLDHRTVSTLRLDTVPALQQVRPTCIA
ncbi:hypothetical protein GDR29_07015 [Xanthomonas oryzae pv. oryzae]|nr:hypothetical protein GDR29_07015 [Xanthomonas oryzae pv. oryzae]